MRQDTRSGLRIFLHRQLLIRIPNTENLSAWFELDVDGWIDELIASGI